MSLSRTISHLFHPQRSNNHRARILHAHSLFQLSGLAIAFVLSVQLVSRTETPIGMVLGYATSISAEEVVQETNKERERLGLLPLTINTALSQAAAAKAQHMFAEQYWAHISPGGKEPWEFIRNSGYTYTVAGENLARDFLETRDMVSAWMASPTHRANIVNAEYQDIGLAVINGELKGTETTLVVQLFGKPRTEEARQGSIIGLAQAQEPTVVATQPQAAVTVHTITEREIGLSPLELTKAVFISLLVLLLAALLYDTLIMNKKRVARSVSRNFGHILLFLMALALILFFKGGMIG